MDKLKPMLFSNLKRSEYTTAQLVKDIISGIIVAIVALPLSIALAIASGVGPEQGIYTAVIAGFIISFLGGSRVQIAGPTAAFATIVAGIVATKGMMGLAIATVMAGIILIIMGFCRFGSLIKFIPYTITTGFTAGIAVTIFLGQIKDFCGMNYGGEAPVETLEKVRALAENYNTFTWQSALVGVICLAVIIVFTKFEKAVKIPPSLVAVVVGILLVKFVPLFQNVATIGTQFGDIKRGFPAFTFTGDALSQINMTTITELLPSAFTIAILAAIESLLSCVVADGMINSHHRSNMELIAQGAGNIGSALFGGIPATGAIARTAANIKSGGRTPVAGMVHSLTLLLVLLLLMPYAAWIPMPTIAAILFVVAYNMCQWRPFLHLTKTAPKSDIIVLVLTFVLTVAFDLVVAIEVGMVVACLLFMKRMSEETNVTGWKYIENPNEDLELKVIPKEVRVYEVSGPLFFGAANALTEIRGKDFTKVIIIRMRSVPAIDATAMNALESLATRAEKKGITLIFSHVNEQPMHTMEKDNFIERIGKENFCENIDAALERATKLVEG